MKLAVKKGLIWGSVGTVSAAAVVLPVVLTTTLESERPYMNESYQSKTFGGIIERITNKKGRRRPNKQFYKGSNDRVLLQDKYPGFRYPAYNFRYNAKNADGEWNSEFKYNEGGVTKTLNAPEAIHLQEKFSYQSESLSQQKPEEETRWASEGFVLDEIKHNRLKKHPAINNMYRDMVLDSVPSVTKEFILPSTIIGNNETGLYIPPGELATITFSDEMYEWIQKNQSVPFKITLNNNAWNGKVDTNQETQKKSYPMGSRYPFIRTDFGFWDGWIKTLPDDPNQQTKPNEKKKKIFPKSFQFGSPFGGIINIITKDKIFKEINGIKRPMNFSFSISGAVETMHYLDGVTTEQDWNQMVKEVYERKRAPFFTANTFFYSFGFPFESTDDQPTRVMVGNRDLKALEYPRKTFRKWFDFLYNSWFFSSGDRHPHKKIDMQFSDAGDIWGQAAGWGGGDGLWVPIEWGVSGFLIGVENWSYGGNWGTYHEFNHNFQQDSAFFKEKGHGQTNEVTMAALSQLNDTLRYRTEFDPLIGENKDWPALANYFGLLKNMNNPNGWHGQEYGYYQNLQYTFGPYNFTNYVRYDVANHWNGKKDWTGISEIINLSDFMKLNLFPATYDYIEKDIWPNLKKDVLAPTEEEKTQIQRIKENYKTIDFVANLYAAGAYVYDSVKQEYYYGGDSNPSFSIPFGENYEFDFKNYVEVIKKNEKTGNYNKDELTFSDIKILTTSVNGAQLIQDAKDPFKVTYVPNLENIKTIGLEDEFDVALVVNEAYRTKYNSVPEYRWKIKVRQETNAPTIEYFTQYSKRKFDDSLKLIDEYDQTPNSGELKLVKKVPYMTTNLKEFLTDKPQQHELSRVSFNYVVPQTTKYIISFKCDDQIRIKIHNKTSNQKTEFKRDVYTGKWDQIKPENSKTPTEFSWKKGDIVSFDVVGVNTSGGGHYDLKFQKVDPDTKNLIDINWIKDSLASNIFEINNKYFGLKAVNEFLTDIRYAYKFRTLDYSRSPFISGVFLDVGGYSPTFIQKNNYDFYYQAPGKLPNQAVFDSDLKDDNTNWEKWELAEGKTATVYLKFKNPQDIAGLVIKHRTSNWTEQRPTWIKVTDLTDNKNTELYNGDYAKEFNDRSHDKSILNFDTKATNASIIKIEMANKDPNIQHRIISLVSISPYEDRFYNFKVSNAFAFNDTNIKYTGRWKMRYNSINGYQSNMNNGFIQSDGSHAEIEFNVYGNGFTFVAPLKNDHNAKIDVYINDELYKSNLTNKALEFDPNANLFSYFTSDDTKQNIKVKVVIKEGSFIFNYINTYGNYSNLFIDEQKGTKK